MPRRKKKKKNNKKYWLFLGMMIIFLSIAIFLYSQQNQNISLEKVDSKSHVAVDFCLQRQGLIKTQLKPNGDEYRVCCLPAGGECEIWAFYKNYCPENGLTDLQDLSPEEKYCRLSGGKILSVNDGICLMPEKIECPLSEFKQKENFCRQPIFLDKKDVNLKNFGNYSSDVGRLEKYGNYAWQIFENWPNILEALQEIKPSFQVEDMETAMSSKIGLNKVGQEFLLFKGCRLHDSEFLSAVAFSLENSQAFLAVKEKDGYWFYGQPNEEEQNLLINYILN